MLEEVLIGEAVGVELSGRRILESVDLRARRGELLAVLGPNGAGKSTLLRALAGLIPFTGRVLIEGDDAHLLTAREKAVRLTLVPQQTGLRSALPVRDVVAQGRYAHGQALAGLTSADRTSIDAALTLTDTARLADRAFTALSFGEQRLVLIARGLATGARILCLDEPTAGLDVQHALQLFALLRQLAAQDRVVIVVLHHLDDALRFADRALLLARGVVVQSGSVGGVITADLVRQVYGVEMRHDSALGFALGDPS